MLKELISQDKEFGQNFKDPKLKQERQIPLL